jgi:hypothetical protein
VTLFKTVNKLQKDVSSTYQVFFAERTNHQCTKRTAMVWPSMTSTLSTAVSIADPARLRHELDEQMKNWRVKVTTRIGWIRKSIELVLD